jgi:hypothetical protein
MHFLCDVIADMPRQTLSSTMDRPGGHDTAWANHNRFLLLIQNLSLGHTFRSSVFPHSHTSANFTEIFPLSLIEI